MAFRLGADALLSLRDPMFTDRLWVVDAVNVGFLRQEKRNARNRVRRIPVKNAATFGRLAQFFKEAKSKMANEKIRIRLKSYDSKLIDAAAAKIVEAAKRSGAQVSGPIPLPTEKEIITILRAVHKYKDSREQFELRTHKRLIDVLHPSKKFVEELQNVELPAGVDIDVKL